MKPDKKLRVTYSISPKNKEFIEREAEKNNRTASNYVDYLLTQIREQEESTNN